jgi:hypothetical protein
MKKRLKIPLLAVIILAVALPVGFAIGQSIEGEAESDQPPIDRRDPDPSTDAIEIGAALKAAQDSGDQEAIDAAAAATRDEWLSRLEDEERSAPEGASSEPDVPAGTYAYLNEAINDGQVEQCRALLSEGHPDDLCELIVLYGEGKIEAGPYTKAEAEAVLEQEGEIR